MVKRPKLFALALQHNDGICCGTDAYFPCDGRWNIFTCIRKAREYYQSLPHKGGYYHKFKLYTGTILNEIPVSGPYLVHDDINNYKVYERTNRQNY